MAMSAALFGALDHVAGRVRASTHLLLCCDLDGGLAPVFDNPSAQTLSKEIATSLQELAASERVTVAIITGRSTSAMRARADIPELIILGNHGLEIAGPDWSHVDPAVAESAAAVEELGKALAKRLSEFPDVVLEERGLSLEIHYQRVPQETHAAVRLAVHEVLGTSSHPFVLSEGMQCVDLRPRVYWHKGEAIRWLADHVENRDALVVFIGGDASDEEAFAILSNEITVRVGTAGETAAIYHVDGPDGVSKFLEWICEQNQEAGVQPRFAT